MAGAVEKQACTWAMLCHLLALSPLVGVGILLGNILGPLIVWLIKKDEHPFVDQHGKEVLNFQISMTIYGVIAGILCFALIGVPLVIFLGIADVVLTLIAAIKAANGEPYRYPCSIRFVQ